MRSLEIVLALVVLATVVAAVAGRLRAPAPSLLVLVGLGVGLVPELPPVVVPPDIVSLVVLPPLLYAAGNELSTKELRAVWRPVAVLAVGLVLATAATVAGIVSALIGLPLAVAFVLGALLASTDPVAVTALARTLRLPPRLQTLVTAESLFNDATSLVLFRVAVGVVVLDQGVPLVGTGVEFVRLGAGGALIGGLVALGVAVLRRRTDDPVLESVINLVTPYGAYVLAESLGASGVTAVVVAGVSVGYLGGRITSSRSRLQLDAVTGTVVFLLESVVFSLIGLSLPTLVRALEVPTAQWLLPALAITAAIAAMRLLWVLPTVSIVGRTGAATALRVAGVVTWAGTRGVVPLAAALSIPLTVNSGADFPKRNVLLVLATTVCILTLVVQGLTLQPLTHRTGVAEGPEREEREEATARREIAEAALEHVESLVDREAAPPVVLDRLVRDLTERRDQAVRALDQLDAESRPESRTWREIEASYWALRRDLLHKETATLARLRADGEIGEAVWRRLQRVVDLEDTGLSGAEG